MSALRRGLVVGLGGLAVFAVPVVGADALWSTQAGATLQVSTAAPTFVISCGSPGDDTGNGQSNSYYSINWSAYPGADQYEVDKDGTPLTKQSGLTYRVLRKDTGSITVKALLNGSSIATSNAVVIATSGNTMTCTAAR